MSTLPLESFSAGLRTSKRFPMGTKIRQMTGMRRPDEEALKRALECNHSPEGNGKQNCITREHWRGWGQKNCPLQTIQLHTPVDSKRLCREARVAISTSYAKPQNHSHWVLIYKFKNLSLRISMQH